MSEKPHWAEEMGHDNLMLRTFNRVLVRALAKIAASNAQNGEDAMEMRNVAFDVLYPEKANDNATS